MFPEKKTLTLEQRDFIMQRLEAMLYPLYTQLRTAVIDEASFEALAREPQDAILTTPNGYERFLTNLHNNDHKGGAIISVIINFKSSAVLQFGRDVLEELERDLFRFTVTPDDLKSQAGLAAFPAAGNPLNVQRNSYQQFDALATYLFLMFLKFYVYGLKIDPRKAAQEDDKDKK
ncbi:hypothetical protein BIZ82_gp227 [Erwinia phage vB_EamM_EarlPhillipIV]|nr:hypothetical protein BIZ82_gp227 [Erwinia phage vB_EamM_EarlPhillipIV]ANZ49076.1 hypothetical protein EARLPHILLIPIV_227 [Erwinia phage vB_EamM_EarlPhillipIV]